MSEQDLYDPIKRFLQAQGYTVKGEVGACDIVAVREQEDPVVVELKAQFNLALLLQAVDRLALCDTVYIAFRVGKGHSATWRTRKKLVLRLLRRLGVGLLTVSTRGQVVAVLDPAPYRPRTQAQRQLRLLKEFNDRVGDPETGGTPPGPRLTAYRQDAIRCARQLAPRATLKLSEIRALAEVERAGTILQKNHYGWFDRVRTGYYRLSPKGRRELERWDQALTKAETEESGAGQGPSAPVCEKH